MAKLNWNRSRVTSKFETKYWNDPVNGFDKEWHQKYGKLRDQNKEIDLGIHETHHWIPVLLEQGPHRGKIICKTCGNKWIAWLPKEI